MLNYLDVPARPARGRAAPDGTLVLLHAFPLRAAMWEPQLALAELGWRIVAPDYRGMGASPLSGSPLTTSIDDYAGDVIDLLDSLHLDEAVFCGVSMGGYVALAVFRHAARYVRGLVLADTRLDADSSEAVAGRKRMLALLGDRGVAATTEDMLPKLLGAATRRDRPDVIDRVRSLALSNKAEGIAAAINALMTRPDSTGLAASIHCPTLVIVGEEDVTTPPAVAREMTRAIGGAELAVLPQAGHLTNLERPDLFNAEVARFLNSRV
jgi:pimeloyl-ACP methyl ester carboxylesterase